MKYNVLDIFSEGRRLVDCHMSIICPNCKREMYWAYLQGRVCYCKECKLVFDVIMKESKIPYEQLKEDGWVEKTLIGEEKK